MSSILFCLNIRDLICIMSVNILQKEKVPEGPPAKTCPLRLMVKTMIIVSEYTEFDKGDGSIIINCTEDCICPICQSPVSHRDWKPRIKKLDGGLVQWLVIERRQCENEGCRRIHSILPDILMPYKHYVSDLIMGVIDGDVEPEDPVNEDYPCDETMRRWMRWFIANLFRAEGYCRQALRQAHGSSMDATQSGTPILDGIRKSCERWLPAVLRMVYNSGGFLTSV